MRPSGVCASNNAPARLVMIALLMPMFPPVQRIVPPFSNVRPPLRFTMLTMLSVTPGGMIVRPLPLIVPPVQTS